MNASYEYYRIFYYVAKYGSFTKAAEVLMSNQPNVTRCMNKLEQETGCRLFLRSRSGAALTPEGSRLFAHVEVAVEQLLAAEEELGDVSGLKSGSVSIGASETALNIFLLEQLSGFHKRYPGIRLRISNHSTPQAIAALRQGSVDLAVVTTPAKAGSPLKATQLTQFCEILVGGSEFAHLADRPLTLAQTERFPLIMLARNTMTYAFYERLFLQNGLVMRADTEAATADQLLPLAKSNLGLAFVPEPLARQALEDREVFRIPLVTGPIRREVVLLTDHKRALSAAGRELERQLCLAAKSGNV